MSDRLKKPNLIYILADDMGYGDVSCLNAESKIRTEHIDRLGKDGIRFGDAHSSSAVCTPSRYSILTGRYNWRSEMKQGVLFGYDGPLIEEGRLTVASMLKSQGYRTGCVGKWHLGWEWGRNSDDPEDIDFSKPIKSGPTTRGFDYYFGIIASLDMPPYVYVENDMPTAIPDHETEDKGFAFWRKGPTAPDFVHEQVLPEMTRKAVDFIKQSKDEPFFLYFPLPAPHTPILPLPEFRGKSGTNDYGDFCLQVDWTVGQVMQAVEDAGITEDTIIVFTSDNGCSPMADFTHLSALGHRPSYHFRGHKADIYEGGHRIPLVARWPNGIKAGTFVQDTVCLSDLLATMAEIIGIDVPDDAGEDSVSNLKLWHGEGIDKSIREATVHHSCDGAFSLRKGRWKLEMCPGSGGWSYPKPGNEPNGTPPIQLYDLEADVSECINLQDQHPEIVEELKALLTEYIKNGRSTPGVAQPNNGSKWWPQLHWLVEEEMTRPSVV